MFKADHKISSFGDASPRTPASDLIQAVTERLYAPPDESPVTVQDIRKYFLSMLFAAQIDIPIH